MRSSRARDELMYAGSALLANFRVALSVHYSTVAGERT